MINRKTTFSSISFRSEPERLILFGITLISLAVLGLLFVYLFSQSWLALQTLPFSAWFGTDWNPSAFGRPSWGALSLAQGTLLVSGVALLLAIPVGLAAAVYLGEVASRPVKEILKPGIEMIASIPSVVLGVVGLSWLVPSVRQVFGLENGMNALTAGLLVAIAALPTVISVAEDSLASVGRNLRLSAAAIGATPLQTIKKVTLPAAKSGVIAAIMLAVGRVVGETMIVLMVAGNSRAYPQSITDAVQPITATIAIEMKETVVGGVHWSALYVLGAGLFIFTFLCNLVADIILRRREE